MFCFLQQILQIPLRAEQCEAYVFAHIDPVVAVKRRVPMTLGQDLLWQDHHGSAIFGYGDFLTFR